MTLTLAIDTSTSRTCVGVIENGILVWSGFRDGATAHGPALPALVREAITGRTIDEVVVGMGPGPFTGLRIGVVFAHSFALARGIPVRDIYAYELRELSRRAWLRRMAPRSSWAIELHPVSCSRCGV